MIQITVQNFQAIEQADLAAAGLTVIVGPSDRGKSALLRAVEAALFNRAGDEFVRLGQVTATVQLTLPDHQIAWEKGLGSNRFSVDGVTYQKVGVKAPPVLQQLGFREEVIGGRLRDDGKVEGGELMRPQVARQFDPIFLLDQPASFVNEVMVKLSRLGVLQRANRTCTADLRAAKAILAVRQTDATEARAAATALLPVVALRERVAALVGRAAVVEVASSRLGQLRALVEQRSWRAPLARAGLPVRSVEVAATLQRGDTLQALRPLVIDRTKLATRTDKLPTRLKIKKATQEALQRYLMLRPLAIEQHQHRDLVRQGEAVALRREEDHQQWLTAFASLKREVKICPTCEKPF